MQGEFLHVVLRLWCPMATALKSTEVSVTSSLASNFERLRSLNTSFMCASLHG